MAPPDWSVRFRIVRGRRARPITAGRRLSWRFSRPVIGGFLEYFWWGEMDRCAGALGTSRPELRPKTGSGYRYYGRIEDGCGVPRVARDPNPSAARGLLGALVASDWSGRLGLSGF